MNRANRPEQTRIGLRVEQRSWSVEYQVTGDDGRPYPSRRGALFHLSYVLIPIAYIVGFINHIIVLLYPTSTHPSGRGVFHLSYSSSYSVVGFINRIIIYVCTYHGAPRRPGSSDVRVTQPLMFQCFSAIQAAYLCTLAKSLTTFTHLHTSISSTIVILFDCCQLYKNTLTVHKYPAGVDSRMSFMYSKNFM